MSSTTLIRQATMPNGQVTDLLIRDGILVATGQDLTCAHDSQPAPEETTTCDATGMIVLPGLVDLHTHLRDPGKEDAETVETGTRAAAKGGFTAVHAMANSTPVADTAGVVEQVWALGRAAGWCDVHPVGAVTVGLAGEQLAELSAMHASQAQVSMFSDDGHCVWDPLVMRRALEYVKSFNGFIAQHAQEPRLTEGAQMNESSLSSTLGLAGWPAVAEESIIARDALLAHHLGSRLHICHVSTAGSVEIIRWAKAQGIDITAEVTPHHLLLTEDLVATYNPVFKVNPPLRRESDVLALRAGLADGTIDTIGTDHAPHTAEAKECEWPVAAMGMTGLETALSVVQHAMIDTGTCDWNRIAHAFSAAPARIAGDCDQGHISPEGELRTGVVANLVLYDPDTTFTVDPAEHVSKSRNTPYRGMELPGSVRHVFYRGHQVVADGQLATPNPHVQAGRRQTPAHPVN
ncbi:dihydroorotase [Auritidibacter sp. NML120779]|nr:dihydroorotase [Auritidibacter sp. NML120779]